MNADARSSIGNGERILSTGHNVCQDCGNDHTRRVHSVNNHTGSQDDPHEYVPSAPVLPFTDPNEGEKTVGERNGWRELTRSEIDNVDNEILESVTDSGGGGWCSWTGLCKTMTFAMCLTFVTLTLLLIFSCEQSFLPGVCASQSAAHVESFSDHVNSKVRLKTTDAGIFVGVKKRVEVLPNRDYQEKEPAVRAEHEHREVANEVTSDVPPRTWNESEEEKIYKGPEIGFNDSNTSSADKYKIYYVFKGIPYAQPPVGDLRWKEPQVVDIKFSAQDNTRYKPVCSQWSPVEKRVIGSQDCLYLNIFTPHLPHPLRRLFLPNPFTVQDIFYQEQQLYPVLIYIHPGDMVTGSGNWYSGSRLLQTEDVVLVTINYRLGIFGYLSSGDDSLPGNYGLLDQIAAIKWVKTYIQRFSGNPTRITVFGDVGYLLMSPLAVGLFHGAIWSAGNSLILSPPSNSSVLQHPEQVVLETCLQSQCCETPSDWTTKREQVLDCLRITPVSEIMQIQTNMLKFHSYPRKFLPVVDAGWRVFPTVMTEPEQLLEMGPLVKVPLILGVNKVEGYELLREFVRTCGWSQLMKVEEVKQCLKHVMPFILWDGDEPSVQEAVFNEIWEHYFSDEGVDETTSRQMILRRLLALFGDIKGHVAFSKLMGKLSRNSKPAAFAYVFDSKMDDAFYEFFQQNWNATTGELPPWKDESYLLTSVQHEDVVGEAKPTTTRSGINSVEPVYDFARARASQRLFSQEYLPDAVKRVKSEEQDRMQEIMAKIWTSFANYGTPKQAVSEFENWTRWYRIERKKIKYYDLQIQPGSMKSTFRPESQKFWEETIPWIRDQAMGESHERFSNSKIFFWAVFLAVFLLLLFVSCVVICCCVYR